MSDGFREEVLRNLKSGSTPNDIYELLVKYKQSGMDKDTMLSVLDSLRLEMRPKGDEKTEDAIIEYMDLVDGWCSPKWRIYP